MRLFLTLLIIIFNLQSLTKADDIKDFEIEGISIGDSLLDHFSKKEIKENTMSNYYKNNKYTSVEFSDDGRFNIYESVEINYLTKDNNYTIESVSGAIFCAKNFSKCKDLEKKIKSDISEQFKNLENFDYEGSHNADKSGDSKLSHNIFSYTNGDMIIIETIDWSKKITQKNGWTDNTSLSVRTNNFNEFLGIAFK